MAKTKWYPGKHLGALLGVGKNVEKRLVAELKNKLPNKLVGFAKAQWQQVKAEQK